MRKFNISGKNELERQHHPIEEHVLKLNQFSSSTNVEKRCLAYASRLIDQGYGDYEIERAVDNWLDTGKGFPNFSDLRVIAENFKPRKTVFEDVAKSCKHSICDGTGWVELVKIGDKGEHVRLGKCLCNPGQNRVNWRTCMRAYQITTESKIRYESINNRSKNNQNLTFDKPLDGLLKKI